MDTLYATVLIISLISQVGGQKRKNTIETEVIVSDFNGYIYRYNLKSKNTSRIAISDRGQGPEALDYDPTNGKLYWTNIRADTIKRSNLDGSNEETLIASIETPRGLVVDYIQNLMFYTEERDDIIGKMNLTSRNKTTILRTGMDRPLAITVDMEDKIIYWTDIGRSPKIEKVNYDGTSRETIASTDMKWPIALSLDETRENLYWCDGSVKKISYMNLLTRERTTVVYNSLTHYYDVSYVDGVLFFIDLKKRNTFQSMLPNGTQIKTYHLNKSLSKWRKLKVIKTFVCDDMTWGTDCNNNCGNCENDTVCNKYSGNCPSGCAVGYIGSRCDQPCELQFHGSGCLNRCGHCHDQETCHHKTGYCEYGCAPGWDGKYCNKECQGGSHGKKCESTCGHCLHGQPCEKSSGNCTSGCDPGWQGASCKEECEDGTFGLGCNFECQCCDGAACHKITGQCPRANVTQRVCPDDMFGVNCTSMCGRCLNGEPCNETTGRCINGCEAGWEDERCDKECSQGFYGLKCAQPCQCSLVQLCDRVSGSCYDVWTPQPPRKPAPLVQYNDTPITTGLTVAVAVLALLLIIAVTIIFKQRRAALITKAESHQSLSKDIMFTHSREPLVQL